MNADKIPFPDKRPPLPLQSLFGTKPESTRQKALESRARVMEFASTIPKPLAKVKREVSFSNDESQAAGQVRGVCLLPLGACAPCAAPRLMLCVRNPRSWKSWLPSTCAIALSFRKYATSWPFNWRPATSKHSVAFRRLLLCVHNHKCSGSVSVLLLARASALDATTPLQPQPLLEVRLVYAWCRIIRRVCMIQDNKACMKDTE
jgi:hypothetical protein